MHRLLLFITILLISYCDREVKEKAYLPKMEFKHTKNSNYSHYFPNTVDSGQPNTQQIISDNNNTSEPIPSLTPQPISNQPNKKENSPGFFASLFGWSGSKTNINTDEIICEEILTINKTVLSEQNKKLIFLTSEKKQLLDDINNIEKNYQKQKIQGQKETLRLETEIDRLNRLIKILSSELK